MTTVGLIARLTAPPVVGLRIDATVRLVQVQIWLLFLVPAGLRFQVLGAIGTPSVLFGLLLLGVWAVAVLTPSPYPLPRSVSVRWVLGAVGVSTLVSYAAMHRRALPADELAGGDRSIILLLSLSGVALVAAEGLPDRRSLTRIVRTVVAGAATMGVVAILQARAGLDLPAQLERLPVLSTYRPLDAVLGRSGLARPAGTATHPIEFGVVTGMVLALAIHTAVYDRGWGWRRWIALVLVSAGIPLSVSRSALLVGLIVVAAFLLGSPTRLRRRAYALMAVFGVAVFVLVPGLLGTLRGYVTAGRGDPSITTRTSDYAAVAGYLRESPWIGRGPGTFLPHLRILDNQYLLTAVEKGILGVVALVVSFGVTAVLGASARHHAAGDRDRDLGRAFTAVGIAALASAATFDASSFPMFSTLAMLLLGLAGAWRNQVVGAPRSHVADRLVHRG